MSPTSSTLHPVHTATRELLEDHPSGDRSASGSPLGPAAYLPGSTRREAHRVSTRGAGTLIAGARK